MHRALYPGTFDPITLGHLNILEKAVRLFDEVILAVADYTGKNTSIQLEERLRLCVESTRHIPNLKVLSFSGLVVELAEKLECNTMLRGLRAVSDFEYELSLALTNKKIKPQIETVFLVPSLKYMYLSSSMVRQMADLGAHLEDFVPEPVLQYFHDTKRAR
ncbi:MAG: pantetheine-phosphate adenylyltransferase [Candidatus Cloacimonetes bacterium]|nr:pantetheine-phosphate adenylyltransferase [Candidatus Cloacimonadota bacterium]HNZ07271.1 pantetheine-phosphate adenylyltransferase [Candidatus Cloacimonadota bacterium]HOH79028.1 pantetheine-phosphate adenylyltransferase [Candidatus Cloacimonadota bacterium]HPN40303.1 pantetheine-phosphate adenylyltransferase [Candidatus Cloacimonadota bacterium]